MNLVNKQVQHKIFGEGNVVRHDDSYIIIGFSSGNKRFVFPDAFDKYLTLVDLKATILVNELIQKRKDKRKAEELELERLKVFQDEKRQHVLKKERFAKNRKAREVNKVHPCLQSVFWCKPEELSIIFTKWEVFTGTIKSGQKKGQPRVLARLNPNSACLLTVRNSDMLEKDRRIVGLFMVNDTFSGKLCEDGYIPAHKEYRLRLTEWESEKMLFWNYYVNNRYPHKITWNTGRQRYFDNIWMAQILQDIISLKQKPQEREYVQRFFKYFCQINQINEAQLPKPDGVLLRI